MDQAGRRHASRRTTLNPIDFGIVNGVTRPIGLPQMIVAGDLNFGGPATLPQGRFDTLHVFNDTLTRIARAAHVQDRRRVPPLSSTRTSPRAPGSSTSRAWTRSCGRRRTRSASRSASGAASSIRMRCRCSHRTRSPSAASLSVDLGLRYEWHVTPIERDDRFVVFDPGDGLARPRRRRRRQDLSAEQRQRRAAPRRHVDDRW